ncbi:MAG: hypothetical protein SGARI_005179, partial [Bacillariaceae sp.]
LFPAIPYSVLTADWACRVFLYGPPGLRILLGLSPELGVMSGTGASFSILMDLPGLFRRRKIKPSGVTVNRMVKGMLIIHQINRKMVR